MQKGRSAAAVSRDLGPPKVGGASEEIVALAEDVGTGLIIASVAGRIAEESTPLSITRATHLASVLAEEAAFERVYAAASSRALRGDNVEKPGSAFTGADPPVPSTTRSFLKTRPSTPAPSPRLVS